MARSTARRWLEARATPEHRLRVFYGGNYEGRGFGNLLRLFRDGKLKVGGIEGIPDLGIQENGFDSITLWSQDREAMAELSRYFESRNFETSGVW